MSEHENAGTPPEDPKKQDDRGWEREVLEAAPGLARLTAGVAWRTGGWAAKTYIGANRRIIEAAVSGESAADLIEDTADAIRDGARDALGLAGIGGDPGPGQLEADSGVVTGEAQTIEEPLPEPKQERKSRRRDREREASTRKPASDPESLRRRGAALIERSTLPETDQREIHPAFAQILDLLSPDEARILRLMAARGSQPAVDVRSWRPFGIGSEQTGTGLSMIAEEAGCRYGEQISSYLNNLFRLGLIWFSRERLRDPMAYQVIECQPNVLEAIELAGGRASIIRRSIALTSFGEDFCKTCIPEPASFMELGITLGGAPIDKAGEAEPEPSAG